MSYCTLLLVIVLEVMGRLEFCSVRVRGLANCIVSEVGRGSTSN